MWPGYDCSVKALNDGIFMNVDTATKFLSMTTVMDKIYDLKYDKYSEEEIRNKLIPKNPEDRRTVVITIYNSISYQLDGIRFDISPKSHVFEWELVNPQTKERTKQKTNMV